MSSSSTSENAMTGGSQTNEGVFKSDEQGQQLLPGIQNEITLDLICTKLPWRSFYNLSLVSTAWLQSIRSHRVYAARVRAHSREAHVVHIHRNGKSEVIALYSTGDNFCYELPPIPALDNRIPWEFQCIALDGKLYLLGGGKDHSCDHASAKVFVLDVAGQNGWKQCASMLEPRQGFGCGVIDGKICVVGGSDFFDPVCGTEMYDPTVDAWSPIMPMPSRRINHQVATAGEELFVFGGSVYNKAYVRFWDAGRRLGDMTPLLPEEEYKTHAALFLDVYNVTKNEWRMIEAFRRYQFEKLFMAKGKLHSMTWFGIAVYDIENKSWTSRRTNSFAAVAPPEGVVVLLFGVLAVHDELFVRMSCYSGNEAERTYLLRSNGFDSTNRKVVWQKTNCFHPSDGRFESTFKSAVMCLLQL